VKNAHRLALVLATSTLLVALAATSGSAATQTQVTTLNASVSGTQVNASGKVTFGSTDPAVVGEDPAGDPATSALGLDLRSLSIGQPDGTKSELVFTIKLGGMETGGIPELFQFNWDITVNGGAASGGAEWSIKTMRQSVANTGGTDPDAAVYSCVPSETGFSCSRSTDLTVVYDQEAAEIRMTVPLGAINASPGARIEAWGRNGQPVWVRTSAAGQVTGGATVDDMTHDEYVVPPKSVRLGLAPAGTPEGDVTFGPIVPVSGNGSFSGSLTASGAGSYDLWARGCIADNCHAASTPVTVA
jgi:hypothetical protein